MSNTPQHQTKERQGLSLTLKINLTIFTVVGIWAIITLLFTGDFEGKFSRVFSTFAAFGLFSLFSVMDTKLESIKKFILVAQVGNIGLVFSSMIVIWGQFGRQDNYYTPSFFIVILLAILIKPTTMLIQWIMKLIGNRHQALSTAASVASGTLGLTLVMIVFAITFDEIIVMSSFAAENYWKIVLALAMLSAIAGVATAIMYAGYRVKLPADAGYQPGQYPEQNYTQSGLQGAPQHPMNPPLAPQRERFGFPDQAAYHQDAYQRPAYPSQAPQVANNGYPVAAPIQEPQIAQSVQPQELLPWPISNGLPLPSLPDGQPDFNAMNYEPWKPQTQPVAPPAPPQYLPSPPPENV